MKFKPLLLLLAILCLQGALLAQPWLQTYPWQDVCHYAYHLSTITAYNVIPAIGSGFVMDAQAGFYYQDPDSPHSYQYRILWKLNESGIPEYRKITEGASQGYQALVSDSQSHYYGLRSESTNSYLDAFDAELNLLSSYNFSSQNGVSARLNDLLWTSQGLLLCGSVDGQSRLLMTDYQFNLLWQGDSVGISQSGLETCLHYQGGWLGMSSNTLACYSATGDTLWTYNSQGMYLLDLLVTDTNRILLLSANIPDQANYGQVYLLEYLPADNELNSLISTSVAGYSLQHPYPLSLVENANGDLLIYSLYVGEQYRILACYAPDGTYLWSRSFFNDAEGFPSKGRNNIFSTSAGELVFCMNYEPFNSLYPNGIAVARTNYLGETSGIDDQELIPSAATICHYPNPARTSLTFGFDLKGSPGKPELSIYNLKGQQIWTGEIQSNSGMLTLNLTEKPFSGLANGVYLYRLTNGGKALQTGKFTLLK